MKTFVIPILSVIALASCTSGTKDPVKQNTTKDSAIVSANSVNLTAEQARNAGIETGKMEMKYISSTIKVNGQVEVPPQNMTLVSIPMGGYLKSTHLLPGMPVRKGQIIGLVEDQQYIQLQQDYLTAKARVAYLEKEYERQRDLNQSKATSDKQFQLVEADFKSQKVLLSSLSQKLQLININPNKLNENSISRVTNIYSPIGGYVSKVNVSPGKYISPTDVLFEIINPSNIHLALNVYEKDLGKLFVGQRVLAYSNNNPTKKYNAKIILINKAVSPERSAEVHCHFEHFDKDLIPGLFMNAEIEVNNLQAYVVPEEAAVSYENKNYIFVSKGNNAYQIMEVQTGVRDKGFIEIAGNHANEFLKDSIVIKGAYTLLMKLKNTGDEE